MNTYYYIIMLKKGCTLLLKSLLLSIYLFSSSGYYLFFVLSSILGLFCYTRENYLVLFCYYFVVYLFFGSILLFIALNYKPSYSLIVKTVSVSFIDNFFPLSKQGLRSVYPVIVFGFTIFLLLMIDSLSLNLFDFLEQNKIDEMKKNTSHLYKEDQFDLASDSLKDTLKEIDKKANTRGFLHKLVNNPTIQYIIHFFNIKK